MITRIRLLTAGESHGPKLSAVLDGIPAGLHLDVARINDDLARRQRGYGSGGRMRIEHDEITLTGGWLGGLTTGAPLGMEIANRDWQAWSDKDIAPMTRPRPGHADLAGAIKYGYEDLRPSLERASARETAMRVAAGAVCKQLLSLFAITVGGYVRRIGELQAMLDDEASPEQLLARFASSQQNDLSCPDEQAAEQMRASIQRCRKDGDTLGGVIETFALGLPPGLGTFVQWDRRLDARIAMALMSIQSVKGVEIGPAFHNAALRGREVHDEILPGADGTIVRPTNRAGGLEGGVTTGQPLVVRVALKPISTTVRPLRTIDLATGEAVDAQYERSDVCAVPRAVVIAEAMLALVLADALMEKLGGDSVQEMRSRYQHLRLGRVSDIQLANRPWRFRDEQ